MFSTDALPIHSFSRSSAGGNQSARWLIRRLPEHSPELRAAPFNLRNNRAVVRAASAASKAADFLLAFLPPEIDSVGEGKEEAA